MLVLVLERDKETAVYRSSSLIYQVERLNNHRNDTSDTSR